MSIHINAPRVGIAFSNEMGKHETNQDSYDIYNTNSHVEQSVRIFVIYNELKKTDIFPMLKDIPVRLATLDELKYVHTEEYVNNINKTINVIRYMYADDDIYANEFTLNCALMAVGSTLNVVDAILTDTIDSGFAIVRPPGHHATSCKCQGFCFFHNVAIGAVHAMKKGKRVLIVDFDVHHGNGTEEILNRLGNKDVAFFTIQRWDRGHFYPGTGKSKETDRILSIGFNGGKGDEFYTDSFKNHLIPFLKKNNFQPDIIIISAGFDAALGDPLGNCYVTPNGYREMINITKSICPKIAMVLEGGYNLDMISQCAIACVEALIFL